MSDQDCAARERSSLSGLLLASHAPLDEAQRAGRMKCSRCGSSRMFYCYSCCALVGLESQDVPNVKLPVKIDIIKHPNETDGKSTAVQARLLAPQDVTIYTYPCIPDLDQSAENIVLVFPGPDAMTVEQLWEYFSAGGESCGGEPRTKRLKAEKQSDAAADTHTCPIQRVVFIDSTWNQTTRIITDERLQALPTVELKSRRTCFWRHQQGCPDTYLATIEAIYYFLKDLHNHYFSEYKGEYDNLLFFFSFLHKLINKAKQAAGKM
ncbi:tRNA-uridine aminocarboxypropyltransferase 1-like [Myxocyprinus asiaticus]|uniref:tRNA-uridine aminocarboxypropyltransferase 1-like n=1 Tax=Myxocyprinus asiaticus TaxID=70543 RepID=UPI0022222918|nr:tRNA-uridine aminocarboxypropyltransferase 1-like [Myxocyprinus asiaticus]